MDGIARQKAGKPESVRLSVVEVSSFQLETIERFHPWIAALLNVTVDHQDRYESLDEYIAAKQRIFENQTASILPCSILMTTVWRRCRHGARQAAGVYEAADDRAEDAMEERISKAIRS